MPFIASVGIQKRSEKYMILRHDVDRFPYQALQMARMEVREGIVGTYYFRIIRSVFRPEIIKEVAELGHEIGYHYEDLSFCRNDFEKSIKHFEQSLERLRQFYPVKTICMHGSPLSRWDNKRLWEKHDYRKYGIIADTSLDINYDEVFYISDNGMAWNKTNTSIRDKVISKYNIPIKSTEHLIELINQQKLPDKIMLNAHPDTFFNEPVGWYLNYLFIKSKNLVKWFVVKSKIYS